MSTMNTTGTPTAVHDYAAAVRRELADLPAHDAEELTGGLEADLLEQYRESGTVPAETPAAYAAELRASAGLEPRGAAPRERGGLSSWWETTARQLRTTRDRYPALRATWDFLVLLRPLWWVVRAWVVYQALATVWGSGLPRFVFPHGPLTWAFFLFCVVLSVSWSQKSFLPRSWQHRLRTGASAVTAFMALLMVPMAIAVANSTPEYTGYSGTGGPCSLYDGVCHDGTVVGPLFVYSSDGSRLENVKFFDPSGNAIPLDLAGPELPAPWKTAPRDTAGPWPAGNGSAEATPGPQPSGTAPNVSTPPSLPPSSSATPAASTPAAPKK